MTFTFPRKYVTFADLLARWKCSEQDLRQAVISGELKPSIRTSEPLAPVLWVHDLVIDSMMPDMENDGALTLVAPMFLYLQWPEQTAPFECTFRLAARDRDALPPANDREVIARWEALNDSADDPSPGWFVLPRPVNLDYVQSDAVFMLEEVVRFEGRNDGDAPSARGAERDFTPRERTTLLNIIGALLELIKSPKPGRDSDAKVIEELVAGYSDVAGISERSIQAKFAEAKRSLATHLNKK